MISNCCKFVDGEFETCLTVPSASNCGLLACTSKSYKEPPAMYLVTSATYTHGRNHSIIIAENGNKSDMAGLF